MQRTSAAAKRKGGETATDSKASKSSGERSKPDKSKTLNKEPNGEQTKLLLNLIPVLCKLVLSNTLQLREINNLVFETWHVKTSTKAVAHAQEEGRSYFEEIRGRYGGDKDPPTMLVRAYVIL